MRFPVPSRLDLPTVSNWTDSSITVSWKSPSKANGIITYYKINYNGFSAKASPSSVVRLTRNVVPYKKYDISVSACTYVGCSEPSPSTPVRTKISCEWTLDWPSTDSYVSYYFSLSHMFLYLAYVYLLCFLYFELRKFSKVSF